MKVYLKVACILIIIFLTIKIFFPYYRVQTTSMEPTINKEQIIIVSRFQYFVTSLKKGDIVLLDSIKGVFEKGLWSHRIIATEGDLVTISNGIVKVNGVSTDFPLINSTEIVDIRVPKGYVFQKGDNKNTLYGLVLISSIKGRVILF